MAVSLLYFVFILYFAYYEKNAPPDLFDKLVNICMIASVFIFIYVIFEHLEIVAEWDYSFITSSIDKNHNNRVEATFFNPNYFALMLEFFIAMGLYKLFTSKTSWKKIIYAGLIAGNILAVLYTGNRTSPIVIVAAVLVFLYILSYKKITLLLTSILGISLIWFAISGYYPRIDSLSWALDDRLDIWKTGLKGIQDNWIFGQGPYTYMQIYDLYNGKFTYHAHSIYIDTLLNYGIFGNLILLNAAYRYLKWLIQMHKYPQLKTKAALVWSLLTIFIVHGLTDLAIYWFQTAFVFLALILLVPGLVKAEEDKKSE
ncbi:MAG: O-antigen ligase family protein [Atopococcus tabaci]|uniref:O-antigen ligase family protein n=1 Tax=Atopococcus tabaci TaxID=269774 RepID=A0AA43RLV0_9LACT|nr:O-antigen ligase family protein [Atopococcus tabaci]